MGMSRYRALFVVLCVVLSLISLAWDTPGWVLCVADDHTAIESVVDGGCHADACDTHEPIPAARLIDHPIQTCLDCNPCSDFPLGGHTATVQVRVQLAKHDCPAAYACEPADHGRVSRKEAYLASALTPSHPDQLGKILSAAVLRI